MADVPSSPADNFYEPKSPIRNATTVAYQAAAVGALVSVLQNALSSHKAGALGVLTRTGGTIGMFTAMGTIFAFTEATVANERQKDDAFNGVVGGCAAGFLAGIRTRSLPMALGSCAVAGAAMGTFDYAGQLAGERKQVREEKQKRFFKSLPISLQRNPPSE
ncbi:hypothetical protein F5J12DRAFT_905303 [Pisolithus orientalis]|uniref:uncharacterized protein n=1 Tax=Pisolithus orientalis TaxID=936130 RepID=UPI0022250FD0|nr:uncharacterized protein F5J12DRAFT_905303 [Pisolithus orientalis]KAI6008235.1 hypothetical protein F5J12DRAFT_905303 [Pisolithus orientalis]